MWAAWSAPASAGTLQVNPILVEINANHRTATVTLRNEEAVPVTIRAYPLAWRQDEGEDRYDETSAVIVSPPIVTIPGGSTQLVRIGFRTPTEAAQAYRLIFEEVPDASPGGGIRVALRLNLPLYASMPAGAATDLRWSASRDADGAWLLEAVNSGRGYVRLDPETARNATGVRFADDVHFGTVLPGATRRWRFGRELRIEDQSRFQRIVGTQAGAGASQGSR